MSQSQRDSIIHLVAGGVAGTTGAIVTCPLEVVKTRLQSSKSGFVCPPVPGESPVPRTTCRTVPPQRRRLWTTCHNGRPQVVALSGCTSVPGQSLSIVQCLRHIVRHEGPMALFKGLGPNLVGVAPSRAVYFCTYSQAKLFWNGLLPPDSPVVHVCSASCAGFAASTLTNPIWFVKTRLQLDVNGQSGDTAMQVVRRIYAQSLPMIYKAQIRPVLEYCSHVWGSAPKHTLMLLDSIQRRAIRLEGDATLTNSLTPLEDQRKVGDPLLSIRYFHGKCSSEIPAKIPSLAIPGFLGFYKGITASYMGITETIVHFVIYEAIKAELMAHRSHVSDEKSSKDFLEFMMAGAISKTVASCIAYPHEVARTRLREEGNKYTGFWQSLGLVFKEEGVRGIYRGLTTQLVRQIPNTAIMMSTYEAVVYILTTRFNTEFYGKEEEQ
ncbi:unnamed protein product [Phaedon cochleariae]|uniref:Mitochondrial carrier protein n=1 Tax=Phaedon cochleariae TaxID=80249 RepID=A0A9P0GSK1_PHACE|nr:unnamed protein product [Phaedon cochleariae]